MAQLNFKFSLLDRVCIMELDVLATVRNIQISVDGVAYKVSFYIEGERSEEWVYEDEIKAVEGEAA